VISNISVIMDPNTKVFELTHQMTFRVALSRTRKKLGSDEIEGYLIPINFRADFWRNQLGECYVILSGFPANTVKKAFVGKLLYESDEIAQIISCCRSEEHVCAKTGKFLWVDDLDPNLYRFDVCEHPTQEISAAKFGRMGNRSSNGYNKDDISAIIEDIPQIHESERTVDPFELPLELEEGDECAVS